MGNHQRLLSNRHWDGEIPIHNWPSAVKAHPVPDQETMGQWGNSSKYLTGTGIVYRVNDEFASHVL